jgi:hypothetical protein
MLYGRNCYLHQFTYLHIYMKTLFYEECILLCKKYFE